MPKLIGAQANVGLAKEGTRGTAESTADYYFPKVSITMDDKIEQVIDESTVGVIEDSTCAGIGHKFSEGELNGLIDEKNVGLLLNSSLGTVSTTADSPESGVNTHVFTVSQSVQHPSLTLFLDDTVQDYAYPLTMVTSLGLDFELDSFAMYTAGFRGKAGIKGTHTASYTAPSTCGFLPKDITFKFADNLAGLDAASNLNVRTISMSIEKNVEDDLALGFDEAVDINNKHLAITGDITLVYNDNVEAIQDLFIADGMQAMRLTLTKGDVTIGASTNPSLTLDFAKVKFNEVAREYGNSDIATTTLSFKAFYSIADAQMIKATLINDVDAY